MTTNEPLWATYFGGFGQEFGWNVDVDQDGFVYFTGSSTSGDGNGPAVRIPFPGFNPIGFYVQPNLSGTPGSDEDGFLAVFSPSLELGWTTYYGRGVVQSLPLYDGLFGVAAFQDQVYVAGYTYDSQILFLPTTDFNTSNPFDFYQPNPDPNSLEAIAARFDMSNKNVLHIDVNSDYSGFLLYPNPNDGQLFIQLNFVKSTDVHIKIYDMLARKVYSKSHLNMSGYSKVGLDLRKLASGTYVIHVESDDVIVTKKLIKR